MDESLAYTEEQESPEAKLSQIEALAEALLAKRDEAIKARKADGCEKRWDEDEEAYDACLESNDSKSKSSNMMDYVTGKVVRRSTADDTRSKVVVNVIRGRTEVCAGRFADTIMPTDDKNWGLKNTPNPDLDEAVYDQRPAQEAIAGIAPPPEGEQPKVSDIAKDQKEQAEKKMAAMETLIADQLNECNFNGECRKVIGNAAKLGTGILKGPVIVLKTAKKWGKVQDMTGEAWGLTIAEEEKPISISVSPRNVYPAPGCGDDIKRASYIWEKSEILPRELRALKKLSSQGYIPEMIDKVLASPPSKTECVIDENGYKIGKSEALKGSAYEMWEYHGDVEREDLEAMGCDCSSTEMESMTACVIFVNDIPIKAALYPFDETGLIYDFFQWSKVSNSVFGQGVPRAAGWAQRVVMASWRAMMDNARNMGGGHVVMGEGIEKVEAMGSLTVWKARRDADVRQIFSLFQINNNQQALQQIIDLALRFLDMETTTPMMFQGDKAELPETLGATNIMVDSANVAMRNRATLWDDQITRPHLSRYYDWNMLYSDNDEIKGEYHVDPRGSRVLVERDQQAKTISEVLALKQDPDFAIMADWPKAFRQLMSARKLDIIKPDAEIKQAVEERSKQQQPQDPKIQAAQIKVQGDMQLAQLNQQSDMAEIQAKIQDAEKEREHGKWVKQVEFSMKQMELMESMNKSVEEIKAKLADSAAKLNLQRELSAPGSGGEVATPPVEPGQRAEVGKSFQQ